MYSASNETFVVTRLSLLVLGLVRQLLQSKAFNCA